jgi:hypothetical protein
LTETENEVLGQPEIKDLGTKGFGIYSGFGTGSGPKGLGKERKPKNV